MRVVSTNSVKLVYVPNVVVFLGGCPVQTVEQGSSFNNFDAKYNVNTLITYSLCSHTIICLTQPVLCV